MSDSYGFLTNINSRLYLGILNEGKLISFTDYSSIKGNIYRAKVISYIKALNGYILDIGEDKGALLRVKNAPTTLKPSEDIIVEIVKESNNNKLHDATAKYTLTDGYIVLANSFNNKPYEVFLRTKGKKLSREQVAEREQILAEDFRRIKLEENLLPSPKLIKKNKRLEECLWSLDVKVISNSYMDNKNIVYDESFNPKYDVNISRGLREVSESKIQLDSGIEVVIDPTEALTVIDINSSKFDLSMDKRSLSKKVNMSCIDDICRLLSIKNIKKMVVIDFLRMKDESDQREIEEKMKLSLNKYNLKSQIFGFTNMGLFEIIIK